MANPRDVTGTIVDLAVRGYLRIEEATPHQTLRDWRLVRLTKTGGLLDYEQILLDGLFRDATTNSGAASTLLSELGPAFPASSGRHKTLSYTDVAKRGWFTARPDRARRRWFIIGCALFVTGAAAMVAAAAFSHLGLVPIPIALAGLVLIGCARWMPVRTAKGTDLARAARVPQVPHDRGRPGRPAPPGKLSCSTTICPTRSCSDAPNSGLM